MKRPSFQFYPADWRNNAKLRRCSEAARGAWIDVICILHDSDEYGVCRWPIADIARAAGVTLKLVKELVTKDVLKGSDKNAAPYIFEPTHAGKKGDPVVLVETDSGSCWYSSRMVRDEYVRQKRGNSSRFSSENQPPNYQPKPPFGDDIGGRQGDGLSSSSTSSSTNKLLFVDNDVANAKPTRPSKPDCPHQEIIALYHEILPMCPQVRDWGKKRASLLKARWNEAPERQNLDYWKRFFEYVATCDFLVGLKPGRGGEAFIANLEWMLQLSKFTNIREGYYANDRGRA